MIDHHKVFTVINRIIIELIIAHNIHLKGYIYTVYRTQIDRKVLLDHFIKTFAIIDYFLLYRDKISKQPLLNTNLRDLSILS